MPRFRSAAVRIAVISTAIVILLAATHSLWLAALGRALVHADAPVHADIAVVLAGDGAGYRIMKAAELARQGYVPKVLVSGPPYFYGFHECDLAIPFAVRRGCPQDLFIALPNEANSTTEEAAAVLAELRRRGVRRALVVTSDYHTARASRIYRRLAGGIDFEMIAARDRYFTAEGWWHSRPACKVFAMEWIKTLAAVVGM